MMMIIRQAVCLVLAMLTLAPLLLLCWGDVTVTLSGGEIRLPSYLLYLPLFAGLLFWAFVCNAKFLDLRRIYQRNPLPKPPPVVKTSCDLADGKQKSERERKVPPKPNEPQTHTQILVDKHV